MPANVTGPGDLRERVSFQEKVETELPNGLQVFAFVDRFERRARLAPRTGSEPVIASRLQGLQPYALTVRSCSMTRQVNPDWRVRNVRSGIVYSIRAVINRDERNQWIEMLVVAGEDS